MCNVLRSGAIARWRAGALHDCIRSGQLGSAPKSRSRASPLEIGLCAAGCGQRAWRRCSGRSPGWAPGLWALGAWPRPPRVQPRITWRWAAAARMPPTHPAGWGKPASATPPAPPTAAAHSLPAGVEGPGQQGGQGARPLGGLQLHQHRREAVAGIVLLPLPLRWRCLCNSCLPVLPARTLRQGCPGVVLCVHGCAADASMQAELGSCCCLPQGIPITLVHSAPDVAEQLSCCARPADQCKLRAPTE